MMKYERLTVRFENSIEMKKCDHWHTCADCMDFEECPKIYDAIARLTDLEDKIEDGRMVELPCKVGDIVYVLFDPFFVADVFKMEVRAILIERKHILVKGLNKENYEMYNIMSDYIFPTKEAAEAKLKELRGE